LFIFLVILSFKPFYGDSTSFLETNCTILEKYTKDNGVYYYLVEYKIENSENFTKSFSKDTNEILKLNSIVQCKISKLKEGFYWKINPNIVHFTAPQKHVYEVPLIVILTVSTVSVLGIIFVLFACGLMLFIQMISKFIVYTLACCQSKFFGTKILNQP
jgi:hypothetical protein